MVCVLLTFSFGNHSCASASSGKSVGVTFCDEQHKEKNIIIIILIIIIIIAKAQFEIFYNLLTAPLTVSNTYTQVAQAQLCANHVQHMDCLSPATYRVPHGTKGQLSY